VTDSDGTVHPVGEPKPVLIDTYDVNGDPLTYRVEECDFGDANNVAGTTYDAYSAPCTDQCKIVDPPNDANGNPTTSKWDCGGDVPDVDDKYYSETETSLRNWPNRPPINGKTVYKRRCYYMCGN